jgi:amino acid transporter
MGATLRRELTTFQATALNMIDMVGIGPFVVTPLVAQYMGGVEAIWAWIAGAVLSSIDAMIWSELGAAMPEAGGTYVFLRETYGREKWGRFMSFLFVWQTTIQAPLVIASGAIGFAQYAGYLVPLDDMTSRLVSGGVVILIVALLYRRIGEIGKLSVFLWIGVIVTLLWVIASGFRHGDVASVPMRLMTGDGGGSWMSFAFWAMMGQASVKTMYSFLGYYNVCHLGAEVRDPQRAIPKSMFLSIAGIAVLYLAMQVAVFAVVPEDVVAGSPFIISTFMATLYGSVAAKVATGLVLWIAIASLFSVMVGYTRIPYAAARDGLYFAPFGKLHPKHEFPHISLLVLGGLAFVFSLLFKLAQVIAAILAMRILVQFIGQAIGLVIYRRRVGAASLPWRMPLYPLPVILAIAGWIAVYLSTPWPFPLLGLGVAGLGAIVYTFTVGKVRA